ncbi:tRNA (guanine(9)-N(1))-methyltransferase [Entamoeba marina]
MDNKDEIDHHLNNVNNSNEQHLDSINEQTESKKEFSQTNEKKDRIEGHEQGIISKEEIKEELQEGEEVQLSKRQLKKQKKKQKKEEYWKETRQELRKARKARAKEKRKEYEGLGDIITKKKKKKYENVQSVGNIIIDCDFDDKMNSSECKSLFNQIQLLYGYNWKSDSVLNIRCVGVNGKLLQLVDKGDARKWKLITFEQNTLEDIKDSCNCVYLTAESDNVLSTLDENTYYIIGGLVDHNKYKGLCDDKAKQNSIRTARLPISENIDIKGRNVLTVNQVFNILSTFKQTNDWKQSLQLVLPQRKTIQVESKLDSDDLSI